MTIAPFKRNHAIVNSRGQIVAESPDAKQALIRYLNHPETKSLDTIRIVVTTPPSEAKTKR